MDASQRDAVLKDTGIYLNTNKDSGSGVGKSKDHIKFRDFLKKLLDEGKIRCFVDRTYNFEEIPEAHRYVETGGKRGSVVVIVTHEE